MRETDEILDSGYAYVKKLLATFEDVAEVMYQGEERTIWTVLIEFTEGIQWLFQMGTLLEEEWQGAKGIVVLKDSLKELERLLPVMEGMMQEKDYVALGDFFHYDMVDVFVRVHDGLGSLIESKDEGNV